MRDLLFKNLTSSDKKRRIVACSEISDKQGIHSVVHRHFVYIVREVKDANTHRPESSLQIIRDRNTLEHREKFFCRLKGSILAVKNNKVFLIVFAHSLKICLTAIPQDSIPH